MNLIIKQWLKHIKDEKDITARNIIKDTIVIAKNKPKLISIVCKTLEAYYKIYEDGMQRLIYKD